MQLIARESEHDYKIYSEDTQTMNAQIFLRHYFDILLKPTNQRHHLHEHSQVIWTLFRRYFHIFSTLIEIAIKVSNIEFKLLD